MYCGATAIARKALKNHHTCATVQLFALIGQLKAAVVARRSIVMLLQSCHYCMSVNIGAKFYKIASIIEGGNTTLVQELKLKTLVSKIIIIIMDNLPNEIVLQILGYLSLGELFQCARVSKRLNVICEDKSLSYRSNMLVMQGLTVKGRKSIIDTLIANPELTEVNIFPKIKVENRSVLEWGIEGEI